MELYCGRLVRELGFAESKSRVVDQKQGQSSPGKKIYVNATSVRGFLEDNVPDTHRPQSSQPTTSQKVQCPQVGGNNPFSHSPGRTIYNCGPDSRIHFADTFREEIPIDPALLAIRDLIVEQRLKQQEWMQYIQEEGPERCAHLKNFGEAIWESYALKCPSFAPLGVSPDSSFCVSYNTEVGEMNQSELDLTLNVQAPRYLDRGKPA
ncbi:hypothetical protein HWV62_6403 [Athelia sp. TMB]|nr:hypothetical protein HWV62_6403 [Athelia sp. TMB]